MLDISHLFPRDEHLFLKWIHTQTWYELVELSDGSVTYSVDRVSAEREFTRAFPNPHLTLRKLWRLIFTNWSYLVQVIVSGDLISNGPKLFRSTREQCEVLSNVKIGISPRDFQTPYRAQLIQFDPEWSDSIRVPESINSSMGPRYALIWKSEGGLIFSQLFFCTTTECMILLCSQNRWKTVEDSIYHVNNSLSDQPPELDYTYRFHRVALNYCLLAVYSGVGKTIWIDAKTRARHERLKGERGELFRLGDIQVCELTQNIKLYDKEKVCYTNSEDSGRTVGPHWRSGHMKMQVYGKGRSLRKLIFIRPIFVHRDEWDDLSNTSVVYSPPGS